MTVAESSGLRFLSISSDAHKLANIRIAMNIASALLIGALVYGLVVFFWLEMWDVLKFSFFSVPFFGTFLAVLVIYVNLSTFRWTALARVSINLWAIIAIGYAALQFFGIIITPGLWRFIYLAGFALTCYMITIVVNGVASVPEHDAATWLRRTNEAAISSSPRQRLEGVLITERILSTFWYLMSALTFSLAIYTAINTSGWTNSARNYLLIHVCPLGTSGNDCLGNNQEGAVFVFCSVLVLAYLLARLAHAFRRQSLRLIRTTALRLMERDRRPPVVFLRSFATDKKSFSSEHSDPLYNICNIGKSPSGFDHLLLDEASIYGPVVAIGKPGTQPPILGVAREFVEDITWQHVATDWMITARRIVLIFGRTSGLNWEIGRIKKLDLFYKTLALVPAETNMTDLWLALDLPDDQMHSKESVIAVVGAGENATILTSRNYTYEAYKISIHAAFSLELNYEARR